MTYTPQAHISYKEEALSPPINQMIDNIASMHDGTGIQNQAIKPAHVDLTIANAAARPIAPFTGMLVWQQDIKKEVIYDGSAWRVLAGWELLGKDALASPGSTLNVSSLPARRYLRILVSAGATGGNIALSVRFNGDTANNYARRSSTNNSADSTSGSQNALSLSSGGAGGTMLIMDINNLATREKTVHSTSIFNTAGAANVPGRDNGYSKWANTSAQITQVTINNGGAGSITTGSELIVLGADF